MTTSTYASTYFFFWFKAKKFIFPSEYSLVFRKFLCHNSDNKIFWSFHVLKRAIEQTKASLLLYVRSLSRIVQVLPCDRSSEIDEVIAIINNS
ncbi:hypothetical protein I8752_17975 [Nostocaceae cyanobacterium CENA369]|uniref:Uncharacterized protein n=1 Tax=Dendronalium phyllosphericum CENA369 TaxID=1725256 RepID=A0A8J7I2X6_9NOST|nr:hypothetical protein [Dendronalium phyllosphericum]MBH8574875.1 hypothetical protein [Dendronalium phyllosphericum CENA369]